ncbi:OmpA family protein [Guyparkeria sp. 1SP6A2]|nr:OmpA family protein [Guyparkeria sp. 1SP6A2]
MTSASQTPSQRDIDLQEAKVAAAAREAGRPWSEGWDPDVRQVEDDQSYWLLTMVDLMTLLLTLFVLLAAYAYQHKAAHPIAPGSGAQVDRPANTDRPAASDSRGEMDPPEAVEGGNKPYPDARTASGDALIGREVESLTLPSEEGSPAQNEPTDQSQSNAEALAGRFDDMGNQVEVSAVAGKVQLRVKDNILFPTAEAGLSGRGENVLGELAKRLGDSDYAITVEGHTDDRPIQTWRYPSNWELSAARAAAVVRRLIDAGIRPGRLNAVGLADTQPIASNDNPEGRAENRRVDLVLELPAEGTPTR